MKCLATCLLIIAVCGCTTLRPIDGNPKELQQFINSGELLRPGDRVRIVTADQKAHRFAVTKVAAGVIVGPRESIPVDEVTSLEVAQRKPGAPFQFDTKVVTDWLIAIGAYAMKPITVDSTPAP